MFQRRDRGDAWLSLGGPHDPAVRALGFGVHPFTIQAGTATEGEFAFSPNGEYDLDLNGDGKRDILDFCRLKGLAAP